MMKTVAITCALLLGAAIGQAQGAPGQPEASLGVADQGIFSDLDGKTQLVLPNDIDPSSIHAVHDAKRSLLVLFEGNWPIKVYPTFRNLVLDQSNTQIPKRLASQTLDSTPPLEAIRCFSDEKHHRIGTILKVGKVGLCLRAGDRHELAPLLTSGNLREQAGKSSDLDKDGIPDTLDVLVGAMKTVENAANYGGGYRRIDFPGGDIPREDGVCTDVVVRAVRNAGLDIQAELQHDIRQAPRAYPMVKKRNPNIDHRRVKTLLPYFKRRWQEHTKDLEDQDDPLRPGDIVFMDTFPKRSGPDHIGIVSNTRGMSGHYLVINNWTNGFHTGEMDLLSFVPITHRFRMR